MNIKEKIKNFISENSFFSNGEKQSNQFEELALEIFEYQKSKNEILNKFWENSKPQNMWEIPSFPIETWKFVKIYIGNLKKKPQIGFGPLIFVILIPVHFYYSEIQDSLLTIGNSF